MAEHAKHIYDESKTKTLSSLEHIRLRTGMYNGCNGNGSHPDDGCYILLKEVIDNAIDEYTMGYGREVHVHIEGSRVSVRDFGAASRWAKSWTACPRSTLARNAFPSPPRTGRARVRGRFETREASLSTRSSSASA